MAGGDGERGKEGEEGNKEASAPRPDALPDLALANRAAAAVASGAEQRTLEVKFTCAHSHSNSSAALCVTIRKRCDRLFACWVARLPLLSKNT